jgi:hypothetical protein
MPKEKSLLEDFLGRSSLTLRVDGKEALEITVRKHDIILDVKKPVALIDMGIKHLADRKSGGLSILKAVKLMGYRVIVKYRNLELEL